MNRDLGAVSRPASSPLPAVALGLALGAAALLGVADAVGILGATEEAVSTLTWLLGWVLLAWAALLGVGCAVHLARRLLNGRPVRWWEAAVTVASLAAVAAVVAAHPLWGTGAALG